VVWVRESREERAVNVADVMSQGVEYVEPSASVQEAAELMGEIDVGALPVGDAAHLDGVVTDRDILYRVVARGLDPAATTVRSVASRPVGVCRHDDTQHAAMDLMAANHVRRLPVADRAGRVVGWITLADVARRLLVENVAMQAALRALTEDGE